MDSVKFIINSSVSPEAPPGTAATRADSLRRGSQSALTTVNLSIKAMFWTMTPA